MYRAHEVVNEWIRKKNLLESSKNMTQSMVMYKVYFFCNILFEITENLSNHLSDSSSNFGLKVKQPKF